MRRLIVNEFMSLDGVVQAPGAADEDTSGGFKHGGWHMRYMADELARRWALGSIVEAGGFLLGRSDAPRTPSFTRIRGARIYGCEPA
jgi:hypothetical protein